MGEIILSDGVPGSGKVEMRSLGFDSPRTFLAHMLYESEDPIFNLFVIASRASLHPDQGTAELEQFIAANAPGMDPLWPALARHIARISDAEDRRLLEDLARHPEKREPPLSWMLKYYIRGDVVMDDGTTVTLDELSEEAGVKPLSYLEQMREEPHLPAELSAHFGSNRPS